MMYAFLSVLGLVKEAQNRVSTYIDMVVKGNDQVIESPYVSNLGLDRILEGWDKIYNANKSKCNPILIDIDMSNRSKVGPRSIAVPWSERKEGTYSYYSEDNKLGSDLRVALSGLSSLRPISLEQAIGYLKNTTNSGLPYVVKKGRAKEFYLLNSEFVKLLMRRDPCILFTRTQEMKKTRTVWGYPMADTLNEMRFYRPLLGYQRKLTWRAALNEPEDVDEGMTKLISKAVSERLKIVSIDFKSYDTTVKSGLQTAAFNYIKSLFQTSFWKEIDYISERFRTIGLVTPDGILSGSHGVPSGSTFTNEVDSIVQYLVAASCEVVKFLSLSQIQGDDGVYITSDPDVLFKCFTKYGLIVNMDKTVVADDYAIYLQLLFHGDYKKNGKYVGVYSVYRALNRILYLERFDKIDEDGLSGQDYFAIRTISILENCKHHPLFEELVHYVATLDKFSLKFSNPGLQAYIKKVQRQEGKDVTFSNWQYGDDVKGIASFETARLLSGKSRDGNGGGSTISV